MHRYQSWEDLLGYCEYSANPVGRLVLYLCGYRDSARQRLSDATCTALQLANFWQDVSRDLEKGRLYIPIEVLEKHGLAPAEIENRRFDERYVALMKDLIARTRELFEEGSPLTSEVDAFLRADLQLFSQGGLAILDAIEVRVTTRSNTGRPSAGHNVPGCWRERLQGGFVRASSDGRGSFLPVLQVPHRLSSCPGRPLTRHLSRTPTRPLMRRWMRRGVRQWVRMRALQFLERRSVNERQNREIRRMPGGVC